MSAARRVCADDLRWAFLSWLMSSVDRGTSSAARNTEMRGTHF